jgi:hypothetical protein
MASNATPMTQIYSNLKPKVQQPMYHQIPAFNYPLYFPGQISWAV